MTAGTRPTKTSTAKPLTAEEAQLAGIVPHGHAWDVETQTAIPIGLAIREDRVRRDAEDGIDGEKVLEAFVRNRKALLKFIASQMVEAEYYPQSHPDKWKRGYPIPGKTHDFYKLPDYAQKALTKQGSAKLAQFGGLKRAGAAITQSECTKEFSMALARVRFVNRWGEEAGSGEAAATTAESSFKRAGKKYGQKDKKNADGQWEMVEPPDFRAAFNDVSARAIKRASTQAIVFATATDEIFDATGEIEKVAETAGVTEEVAPARLPASPKLGAYSGRLLSEVPVPELVDLKARIIAKAKDHAIWQPVVEGIDDELDRRREDEETF